MTTHEESFQDDLIIDQKTDSWEDEGTQLHQYYWKTQKLKVKLRIIVSNNSYNYPNYPDKAVGRYPDDAESECVCLHDNCA